uniref:Uncharacterized protein n=1 Tax=Anopheles maculatus TaxID=74869 RepID=A0A182SIK1_9DIPT
MAPNSTLCVITLWSVSVLILLISRCDRTDANFITYVDDSGENVPEDYVLDTRHRRKKVRPQDYNDALDRLIADALNQTTPRTGTNDTSSEEQGSSSAEQSVACMGERKVSEREIACRMFSKAHRRPSKRVLSLCDLELERKVEMVVKKTASRAGERHRAMKYWNWTLNGAIETQVANLMSRI